jgi:hypothetical protein
METISFFIYFGVLSNDIKQENIKFSENIDYCSNIMFDPRKEDEFFGNCNLEEVNRYIMIVKEWI